MKSLAIVHLIAIAVIILSIALGIIIAVTGSWVTGVIVGVVGVFVGYIIALANIGRQVTKF
jgi:hypothetical protein